MGITDLRVMARALCYGHAESTEIVERNRRPYEACSPCQHNTMGDQCNVCKPLYRDQPFERGTGTAANACEMCTCNGHANSCTYSADAGAGVCSDCDSFTTGDNCDSCVVGYYRPEGVQPNAASPCLQCSHCNTNGVDQTTICVPDSLQGEAGECVCVSPYTGAECKQCVDTYFFHANSSTCRACECDDDGSVPARTCDAQGVCQCKTGYTGDKCQQCADGFYRSAQSGLCVECACNTAGTDSATSICDKTTGQCPCSAAHTGRACDACVDGYFLQLPDLSCSSCGCFAEGSVSEACDSDGVCTCVPDGDYVGDKCSECRPGLTANFIRQCAQPTGDVLFVVDVSASVSSDLLLAMQQFLRNTISALAIGSAQTRAGIVSFSTGATIAADLNDHFTVSGLQGVVAALELTDADALLGGALSVARSILRSATRGGRAVAPDAIVVLTASTSQDSVSAAASILKAEGVAVSVVAIGELVTVSQLQTVATDADMLSLVSNSTTLQSLDLNLELTENLCDDLQGRIELFLLAAVCVCACVCVCVRVCVSD